MKRLSQTESPIFVILCVLCSKGNHSAVAGVVPFCGRKKSPHNHNSAGYILFPLGLLSPSWLFLKLDTT